MAELDSPAPTPTASVASAAAPVRVTLPLSPGRSPSIPHAPADLGCPAQFPQQREGRSGPVPPPPHSQPSPSPCSALALAAPPLLAPPGSLPHALLTPGSSSQVAAPAALPPGPEPFQPFPSLACPPPPVPRVPPADQAAGSQSGLCTHTCHSLLSCQVLSCQRGMGRDGTGRDGDGWVPQARLSPTRLLRGPCRVPRP